MRIIAGEARGRRLYAPSGEETRPTADRIRESVFNILGERAVGTCVLDLFGGSGALAFEAMSRGAKNAVIVDSNVKAIQCIRRNAQAVLGDNWEDTLQVIRADYRKAIERAQMRFDLVFLDPPYRMEAAYFDALERLQSFNRISEGATVVLERAKASAVRLPSGFARMDERFYGETAVEFIVKGDRA